MPAGTETTEPARPAATPADPPRDVALIVNRRARRGGDEFEHARDLLDAAGLAPRFAVGLDEPGGFAAAMDEALRHAPDAVVVGGGDGTIAAAATRLRGGDVPLGILPLGTANSFARSLEIPTRLEDAVATIAAGRVVEADLGRVDAAWFANSAAMGLPGQLADADLDDLKHRFGRVGYLLGGLPAFFAHRPFRVRLVADGTLHELDALEIVVANGRYHGGVLVTLQAHVDSHVLVARIVKGRSPWDLAAAWLRSAIGRPAGPDRVELVRFRNAKIETDPPQRVMVDGEPVAETPVEVVVAAGALRVYAPAGDAVRASSERQSDRVDPGRRL